MDLDKVAVGAAFTGDIAGAIDILRGIDAEIPGDDDETADAGSAELLGSLALYYLPPVDPSAPQLLGERKQIEPR